MKSPSSSFTSIIIMMEVDGGRGICISIFQEKDHSPGLWFEIHTHHSHTHSLPSNQPQRPFTERDKIKIKIKIKMSELQQAVKAIKAGKVTEINLNNAQIGENGAKYIADALKENKTITAINIGQ